jgi:hypothetical protein
MHPKLDCRSQVDDALSRVNRLQNYCHFFAQTVPNLPNNSTKVSAGTVRKKIEQSKDFAHPKYIAVIANPLFGDWFTYDNADASIVSTNNWDADHAPPGLPIYLIYVFSCALLTFAAPLTEEILERLQHKKLRGCVYDYFNDRHLIHLKLVGANVCAKCEGRLAELELPPQAMDAVGKLLNYVRSVATRRPAPIPNKIFIGHGRAKVWQELQTFLVSQLKLEVIEFNRVPAAGISTTSRLEEMLDQSCFALLVMTAEDFHRDGLKHARMNVIHEVGLFQGRLGDRKSVV